MSCKEAKVEDRLSALPDSTLTHILSFLPIKYAVQTVLIRRFGTLWTSLPVLDFNDEDFFAFWPENEEWNSAFFQFVHNVLKFHQRPTIEKFRIKIDSMLFIDIQMENPEHELNSWVSFAIRKQVKVLEFEFSMIDWIEILYQFPISDLDGKPLVELKLMFVEINLNKQVYMGSLRVLKLYHVTVSDSVFKEIIQGCPSLKELEISQCWDLKEISVPTLEKLKFDRGDKVYRDPYLRIHCPKMSSFGFCGDVQGLELINISSMVDLAFDLSIELETREFSQFQSILSKLLLAKTVSLSLKSVLVMFYCLQKHLLDLQINWKCVELQIWLTEKHISGLYCFLRKSPFLQELVINVASCQNYSDQLWSTVLEPSPGGCMLDKEECWSYLKSIAIYNASMCEYPSLVSLVETLLKHAPVLDKLVICCSTSDKLSNELVWSAEQLSEFSYKLSTFSKASQLAEVLLF